MKKALVFSAVLILAGMTSLVSAAPVIKYNNELPVMVWDISGEYSDNAVGDGITVYYDVTQDGKGKLSGDGYAEYNSWELDLYMDFNVSGNIKSKDGVYSVLMKLSGKGVAYSAIYDETIKFGVAMIMKTEIDTNTGEMYGTMKVRVSAGGQSESITETYYGDIDDPSMDGSATVYTDISEVDGKLLGISQIELSNGRIVYCGVKAKENAKDASLKITAKGVKEDPDSNGSKVNMVLDMGGIMQAVKGKVCGQQVKWAAE